MDITIEKALQLERAVFIDLRSPKEYQEAHIPNAVNIPLFDNEERAIIGTIYKRTSPDLAVEKGLTLFAPKLPGIFSRIREISRENTVILYCWRGGMRSKSLSQLLNTLGIKSYRLENGFKSYRHHVIKYFENKFSKNVIVLHGLTGVGKTELLNNLKKKGLPAVDLEGLANNRGSVFGQVGLGKSPSQKQFEGLLYYECIKYAHYPNIMVECESRRIGRVIIPEMFFNAMQSGKNILVYDSLDNRIERLVGVYTNNHENRNDKQLEEAIKSLKKRIGNKMVSILIQLLHNGDYKEITKYLLLEYYDPLYHYPDKPSDNYEINLNSSNKEETLRVLEKIIIKDN